MVEDDFGLEVRHSACRVALYSFEEILFVVTHYDVEILVVSFLGDVAAENLAHELVFN